MFGDKPLPFWRQEMAARLGFETALSYFLPPFRVSTSLSVIFLYLSTNTTFLLGIMYSLFVHVCN